MASALSLFPPCPAFFRFKSFFRFWLFLPCPALFPTDFFRSVSSVSGFFPFQVLSVSGLLFSYPVFFRFKSFFCFGLFLPCPVFFSVGSLYRFTECVFVFVFAREFVCAGEFVCGRCVFVCVFAQESSSVQCVSISGKCLRNPSSSAGAIFHPPTRPQCLYI